MKRTVVLLLPQFTFFTWDPEAPDHPPTLGEVWLKKTVKLNLMIRLVILQWLQCFAGLQMVLFIPISVPKLRLLGSLKECETRKNMSTSTVYLC